MKITIIGGPHHLLQVDEDSSKTSIELADAEGHQHEYVQTSWTTTALPGERPVRTETFFVHSSLPAEEAARLTMEALEADGHSPTAG